MRFTVFQVSETAPTRFLFADMARAEAYGGVKRENYDEVYSGFYDEDGGETDQAILEDIFIGLNAPKKPDGYCGRSMSVSDVVLLEDVKDPRLWYCDNVGWYWLGDGWRE